MSQANAKTALGASIKVGLTGQTRTAMAELLQFNPPKIVRPVINASDLSTTGGEEYIQEGLYDIMELSGVLHWIAGSTTDDTLIAGVTVGGLYDIEYIIKAASGTESGRYSGYFTEIGGEPIEIKGKQGFAFTFKGSGDYAQAVTV